LNETEKQIVLLCNLARINGKLFSETILKSYIEEQNISKNSYVLSLISDLEKTKNLRPLVPDRQLFDIAHDHSVNMGLKGKTGHPDFEKRYKKVMKRYNIVGENCDYGSSEAIEIVMRLLIDDGIKDVGHRKNILNSRFKAVGVSIAEHKKYIYNCVMSFGGN
jgi:uncharacterized protein YkwD